jgi:hypothetical protein
MLQLAQLEFRALVYGWPPKRLARARREIEEERLAQEKVGQAVNKSTDNNHIADSEFSFHTSSYNHSDARTEAADETARSATRVSPAVLTSLSLCCTSCAKIESFDACLALEELERLIELPVLQAGNHVNDMPDAAPLSPAVPQHAVIVADGMHRHSMVPTQRALPARACWALSATSYHHSSGAHCS